jgi:hypothetical protein
MRWRLVLPLIGLILFGAETYDSLSVNRQLHRIPSRYFWWSSIRLNADPLNKRSRISTPASCREATENCTSWDLENIWITPGLLARSLMLSAFPAFMLGVIISLVLGRLGVNEISSFMLSMPLLVFAWYYFVGWLVDRVKQRHSYRRQS